LAHDPVMRRVGILMGGSHASRGGHSRGAEGQAASRQFVMAAWRDFLPVALVVGAAILFGFLSGGATSRPTQIAVLGALLITAYGRPISVFYATHLCQAAVILFPGIVPGWHIMGPGMFVAALLGSRKTTVIGPRRSPFFIVSFITVGYLVINALYFGSSLEGYSWWPQVFVLGSGLMLQILVSGKAGYLSAWLGVVVGSVFLAGVTAVRILLLALPSIHHEAGLELSADSNYLSMLIGLGVLPAIALAKHLAEGGRRLALILTMLCVPICLLSVGLLASRGIMIALVVGFMPMILGVARNKRGWIIFVIALIIVIAMLNWLGVYQGGEIEVFRRFSAEIRPGNPLGQRYTLAQIAWEAFAERPALSKLFGGGPYSNFLAVGRKTPEGWMHTHNAFLEYLLDYGLIGVGLFLALFWLAFRSAVSADADVRFLLLSQFAFLAVCCMSINPFVHLSAVISLGLIGASYRGLSMAGRRPALLHRRAKA